MTDLAMNADTRYWVGFDHISGLGFAGRAKLRAGFGTMQAAWEASAEDLVHAGLSRKIAESVVSQRRGIDLDALMSHMSRLGVVAFPFGSGSYPSQLRGIENPPNVLYVRGELRASDLRGVTVVGTRECTRYGKSVCAQFAADLARRGVTVVSDLVRGIDWTAHRSALDAGGRTMAVVASGLDQLTNGGRRLADEIVSSGAGCLVSEHPLGVRSYRGQMRLRNRLLSGLSRGVLVVEAPRKSGTMLTVGCALEQGREVFAIPGRANSPQSEGTNWLISQGAKLVTEVNDIIDELGLDSFDVPSPGNDSDSRIRGQSVLADRALEEDTVMRDVSERPDSRQVVVIESDTERRIVDVLNASAGVALNVDEIARESGLSVDKASGSLLIMEVRGCVLKSGIGYRLPPSVQHAMAPMLMAQD